MAPLDGPFVGAIVDNAVVCLEDQLPEFMVFFKSLR
jgi:hypothetical protein